MSLKNNHPHDIVVCNPNAFGPKSVSIMVLFFGWADISPDYRILNDYSDQEHGKTVTLIKKYLKDNSLLENFSIRYVNGQALLQGNGCTNHWSKRVDDVIRLFRFITENAPGSFGLLHFHNDEDPVYGNRFRVLRIAKGELQYFDDDLLSPVNPTLEE